MKISTFLKAAYVLFFLTIAGLLYFGAAYYLAPSTKKVRLPLHPVLGQSGSLGHFFGIAGALFMILLLVYSLRKRLRFMRNWGNLNSWLEVHIFLGLAGPILVFFHSDLKFSGLVGLSFWSMVLVVMSGVVGRYIYQSIPRSMSGMELSGIELEAEEIGLTFELRKLLPRGHPFWTMFDDLEKKRLAALGSGSVARFGSGIRFRIKLNRALKNARALSSGERRRLSKLIMKRQTLLKRKQFLARTMKVLHYWHLLHIPFVLIMFLILVIHIYVTLRMGYRWIL